MEEFIKVFIFRVSYLIHQAFMAKVVW